MELSDLLIKQYGVKTYPVFNRITAKALNGVITPVLFNDPSRCGWSITNLGSVPLFLSFTPDPSATKGIMVADLGGYVSLVWNEDFELITLPVWAYCTGADDDLYIVEDLIL
jgi:hypothetical protein